MRREGTALDTLAYPSVAADLEKLTQQTFDLMKDATTTGITTADGLTGFGLEPVAKLIVPVATQFRNSVKRTKAPSGSTAARWKAIVGYGYTQPDVSVSFGSAATLDTIVEQDYVAPYQVIGLGGTVWRDAEVLARGFDNVRATSSIKTMYELMNGEDIKDIGGQQFALQVPAAPTLVAQSSGGSIGTGTWKVAVAARTAEGVAYGTPLTAGQARSTPASPAGSVTIASGSTNSIVASVAYVAGAFCYDWYTDNGLGGSLYYYGTSSVNTITITAAAPNTNPTAPATDSSANALSYNGFAATLVGDYTANGQVTRGTGTRASGATISSLNGATMTGVDGSIQEIDNLLLTIAQTYKLSPTRFLMNPQEAYNMTNKIFATGGFRVMLQVGRQQDALTGGTFLERYINKAWQGQAIQIVVDPNVPAGHILGITDTLPYPGNRISGVLECETQEEYTEVPYATARVAGGGGGPRYDYEVRCIKVLKNYFPAGAFILHNVANG